MAALIVAALIAGVLIGIAGVLLSSRPRRGAATAAATWRVYVRGGKEKNVTMVWVMRLGPKQHPRTVAAADAIIVDAVRDDAVDYELLVEAAMDRAQRRARLLNAHLDTTPGGIA